MGSWFQREEKKPKKPRKKSAFHSFLLKILTRKINSRFLNGIKEQDKLWNLRKYKLFWWELNKIRGYYQSYVCTLIIIKLMLFHFNKCWIWLWWLLSVLVAMFKLLETSKIRWQIQLSFTSHNNAAMQHCARKDWVTATIWTLVWTKNMAKNFNCWILMGHDLATHVYSNTCHEVLSQKIL